MPRHPSRRDARLSRTPTPLRTAEKRLANATARLRLALATAAYAWLDATAHRPPRALPQHLGPSPSVAAERAGWPSRRGRSLSDRGRPCLAAERACWPSRRGRSLSGTGRARLAAGRAASQPRVAEGTPSGGGRLCLGPLALWGVTSCFLFSFAAGAPAEEEAMAEAAIGACRKVCSTNSRTAAWQ